MVQIAYIFLFLLLICLKIFGFCVTILLRSDNMKKGVSLFLSLLILLSCLSIIANASYEDSLSFDTCIEGSWIVDVKNKKLSGNAPLYYYQYDSNTYSLGYSCYDYLDDAQKYVYDAIVDNAGKLSFTITFPNNLFAYSNFVDSYLKVIMDAICIDRPDIFYYAGYSISGGTFYSGNKYIKTLNYNVGVYDENYYTSSNISGYYNALMTAVKNVPVDLSNRYNFIKSIHDYLADTVYYPDLTTSDYVMSAHDAYGALVEGRAVCQGYSDAFKLLCDYYNIPCICIPGTSEGYGHMWNAIQMDDGKWYFMDLTWDDQESTTYYDFFLVGAKTRNSYFGGAAFDEEHVNDEGLLSPIPSLYYSDTAYVRKQDHNTRFNATYNCAEDADENVLYLSVFDAGKSDIYFNGIYVDVPYIENDVTFTAPSGTDSAEEEWVMYLLADLNSDGVCNEYDYSIAINLAVNFDGVIDTTEEYCCDINMDGYINVIDSSVIARASTGLNTNI